MPRIVSYLLLLTLWMGLSPRAQADVALDVDVFYFTDTFGYASATSAYKRTLYDFCLSLGLGKKSSFLLGWNYGSMSFSDNPGTEEKLSVTDMGPKLTYFLNKDRNWLMAFTYNLISKGSHTSGAATATELRGTSMKLDVGYMGNFSENFLIGAKISYYKAAFSETVVDTTITKVANSRTAIYPNIALTYRFE